MSIVVYIEGKANSYECRKAFHKLFEGAGLKQQPKLIASGSRNAAFRDYAHAKAQGKHALLLVDSEKPVQDIEATWAHLENWKRPNGAPDTDVLLMTTSMETWIVADQDALKSFFPKCLTESRLPRNTNLESLSTTDTFNSLHKATANCAEPYSKGDISFKVLAAVDPAKLLALPSFARAIRILKDRLP